MNEEMLTTRWRFHFWEEREEYTKLRIALFPPCFTALVLHLQREKSRYKIAGIDYEKHGDGVYFGAFGSQDWESVLREKDKTSFGLPYGSVTALT